MRSILIAFVFVFAVVNAIKIDSPFMDDSPRKPKHHCIHDVIAENNVIHTTPGILHTRDVEKRGGTQAPIRIHVDTSALDTDPDYLCTAVGQWRKQGNAPGNSATHSPACASGCNPCTDCWFQCTSDDVFTPAKKNWLKNVVIPDVKDYFTSALAVDPVVGNLQLTGLNTCGCGGTGSVPVASTYQTPGIAADMVIFISARTTRLIGSTIAFACTCAAASSNNRPIAGYINWGPNQMDISDPLAYPEQLGVGIHELTHALGFSKNAYPFYTTPDPYTTHTYTDNSLPVGERTHDVTVMTSTKVLQVARDHFNCPGLVGVELENGGGSGTASSHWERRLFMNEYMTGYSSYDPVFSEITLALLEDSGWYYPNYSAAGELLWGKDKGCPFVQERCTQRTEPYNCDPTLYEGNAEGCTWDGLKKGRCNVREYTAEITPEWYQYYTQYPNGNRLGGTDDFADYCGFYRYQSNYRGDCTVSEFNNPGESDFYYMVNNGEVYSPSSRCITATAPPAGDSESEIVGPSCHNFTCVDNLLKMKIASSWYDCRTNGQTITITGYEGSYQCPSNVAAVCAVSPTYDAWPEFDSVSPTSGAPGVEVTVIAKNLGDATVTAVYFGQDYGCNAESTSISYDGAGAATITCSVGQRPKGFPIREDADVDVVVVDNYARTATGVGAFTMSDAMTLIYSPLNLLFLIVVALFASF